MGITQKVGGATVINNLVGPKGIVTALLSFETGEQAVFEIPFPFKANILALESIVIKALTATDAGTITPANSVGNITGGTLTHAASAAQGDKQTASTLTANTIIAKDTDLKLTPAKTTVGGKVQITVHYQRIF